jgi:hypothetical protein
MDRPLGDLADPGGDPGQRDQCSDPQGFSSSSNAWLELQWYLFGAAFMLAAAYTLKHNEHIRIDIFYGSRSRRTQHWIDLFGHVFFLCLRASDGLDDGPLCLQAWRSGRSRPTPAARHLARAGRPGPGSSFVPAGDPRSSRRSR